MHSIHDGRRMETRAEFVLFEQAAQERFLGTRYRAISLRDQIEQLLTQFDELVVDFKHMAATQSFIDELLGVLVLKHGPGIIERLVFRSCSEDIRSILNFVIGDRIEQYQQQHQPPLSH